MKGLRAGLASLIIAITGISAGAAVAGDPSGTWVMANGKVTVRVSKCSAKLCARIVGLKEPLDKAGRPKVDKLNPNPALAQAPTDRTDARIKHGADRQQCMDGFNLQSR